MRQRLERYFGNPMGNLRDPNTLLAIFGLVRWQPQMYRLSDISATSFRLDLPAAIETGFLEIVFVFFFVDLFDNVGTLVAVGKRAGAAARLRS
jgi:AGZA family xanthine/uracil permease-like MFS transporter